MSSRFKLREHPIIAFVPTRDPERVRAFYRGQLGLSLVADQLPFALVFDAHGIMLRVIVVRELTPAPYTQLGWEVPNMEEAVKTLAENGIRFERYSGMDQDELGIWTAPGGDRVAWFQDPDGNVLSLSKHS